MKLIHPYVRCYECDGNGSVLLEVDPDAGPVYESCETCGQRRQEQKAEILADAKVNYTLHLSELGADGARRATVSYGPANLGVIVQRGSSWVGFVPFAGEWHEALVGEQTVFDSPEAAAESVVRTAATYGLIG